MSPNPKAADFDLFAKGVDPEAVETAVGFLGSLPLEQVPHAKDFVLNAAWHFYKATEEQKEAPSRPALANRLGKTIETAGKLIKQLNSISGYVYSITLLYNLLDIEAGYREGRAQSNIEREALLYSPFETRRRLKFLIRTLTLVKKGLNIRGLDVGTGPGNWHKSLYGPPKWNPLALECHDLFEDYRPGEARSTTGGDFYLFYTAIYRVALDADPEGKRVGASHYVEEVCRLYRDLAAIKGPLDLIRRELKSPDLPKGKRRELLKAQDEYIQRLRAIKAPYPWP